MELRGEKHIKIKKEKRKEVKGMKVSRVALVDGTKVMMELDSVCFPKQTFVRLGPRLIAGIVDTADGAAWQGIYLWRQKATGGPYNYIGDLIFRERDESIALNIYGILELPKNSEPSISSHAAIPSSGVHPDPPMVDIGFAFAPELFN